MPRTPDRVPGPSLEEELQLQNRTTPPTVVGGIRNTNGDLLGVDQFGVFNLRTPLPPPSQAGDVLFARSATEFTVETPLCSSGGWLVNDDCVLLVVG